MPKSLNTVARCGLNWQSLLAPWAAATMLWAVAPTAQAQVLTGSPTSLSSTAERMISYRHQEHSWFTADGAMHVVINRGKQKTGDALALYSTYDGGATWKQQATLPKTDANSVSDGAFNGSSLDMVYASSAGDVRYAQLAYDSVHRTWALTTTQNVPLSSSSVTGANPSLVIDTKGNAWVAFIELDTLTGDGVITLGRRAAGSTSWTNTGLQFGPKDNLSPSPNFKRSARLVLTPTGIGMVYTVREQFFWAERPTAGGAKLAWTMPPNPLYTSPYPPDSEPVSSHFSTVVDNKGYIHMVLVDGGNLMYERYDSTALAWGPIAILTTGNSATYPQITWMGGAKLAITVNVDSNARVYQSSDRGASGSFVCTARLMHPTPTTGVDYGKPRMEAPSIANTVTAVPVLQQYLDGSTQRALHFDGFTFTATAGCKQ